MMHRLYKIPVGHGVLNYLTYMYVIVTIDAISNAK